MEKKHILITGGTGGIGSHVTKMLIENGYNVTIWAKNIEKFKKLKKDLAVGKELQFKKVDVSNEKEVKNAAKKIKKLNVLINASAVLWPVDKFLDCSTNQMRRSLDISMWGTIYCCYHLLPILLNSRNGKIINFSGGGGANGRKSHMAYSIAKTALIRFTENIALEYPKIQINIIAPGAHKTNMWYDEKSEQEPTNWGNINDLMEFIEFLISNKSNGINGKFINYKDNWKNYDFINKSKTDIDFLTLRRIDDFQFSKIKK